MDTADMFTVVVNMCCCVWQLLQLFDTLRSQNVNFQSKVVALAGDILEPELGLSDSDIEQLSSEVSLVFHSAATVKFDEPLKW